MTTYQVKTAAAVVRDNNGAQHIFYEKAVFDDGNFEAEHVKMLAKEGFIEKFTSSEPEPESEEFDPAKVGGVKETLAYVGDDKAKATAMLEAEQAKGDKARASLVEKLEAIVTEPSS